MPQMPPRWSALVASWFVGCALLSGAPLVESLDRGVVAVHQPDGRVFVSWRLLATDPADVAFDVLRTSAAPLHAGSHRSAAAAGPETVRLNSVPLTGPTWFIDERANLSAPTTYTVRAVIEGRAASAEAGFTLPADAPPLPYHRIPLRTPPGYTPNDASAADLDGDGDYEIVLKQEQQPRDNSRGGATGRSLLQAYGTDGRLFWTIDLGPNIREGAHYTPFIAYDLDGDGQAEVACRTADGTIDGTGRVLGDASADWRVPAGGERNLAGHIIAGPEYLTLFAGRTGAALASVPYVPRRHPDTDEPTAEQRRAIWGDASANRSDRFLATVAYLDGTRPSLVFCRGYYTRSVLAAWDWRDGALSVRWVFDSDDGTPGNQAYRGQGNHSVSVADVDADGRDEIVYGAAVIDDNGRGLYTTGWGHGDALHVSDFDPANPGLEVLTIQERFDRQGVSLRDARSGRPLALIPSVRAATEGGDKGEGPGRGVAANIDPRHPGAEFWAAGAAMDGLHNARGEIILAQRPRGFPCNFVIWWDGDLLRELLDHTTVSKWDPGEGRLLSLLRAQGCASNNTTKGNPALTADLWGDWREEVVWRSRDNQELRIYTSTIPTPHRLRTLMQDPQYRVAVAWQNAGYNQPPHPSFALDDATPIPVPRPVALAPRAKTDSHPQEWRHVSSQ